MAPTVLAELLQHHLDGLQRELPWAGVKETLTDRGRQRGEGGGGQAGARGTPGPQRIRCRRRLAKSGLSWASRTVMAGSRCRRL